MPFREMTITWGDGVDQQCAYQCRKEVERCTHYEFDSATKVCKLYEGELTEAPTATETPPTAAPFMEITILWGEGVDLQCDYQCKKQAERCTHYEFDSATKECKLYDVALTEAPTAAMETPPTALFMWITITWGDGVDEQCSYQCRKKQAERCAHYEFDGTTKECKLYEAIAPTEAPTAA